MSQEVYNHYDNVEIRDFLLNPVINTDINPIIGNLESGMVMMKKGQTPKSVNFGGFEYMQMEIRRYFKISNPTNL